MRVAPSVGLLTACTDQEVRHVVIAVLDAGDDCATFSQSSPSLSPLLFAVGQIERLLPLR